MKITKRQLLAFLRWCKNDGHTASEFGWAYQYHRCVENLRCYGLLAETQQPPTPTEKLYIWEETISFLGWDFQGCEGAAKAGIAIGCLVSGRTVLRPGDILGDPADGQTVIAGNGVGVLTMNYDGHNDLEYHWIPMDKARIGEMPVTGFNGNANTLSDAMATLFRHDNHLQKVLGSAT